METWGHHEPAQELVIDIESPGFCGGPRHGNWALGERDASGTSYYGTWAKYSYGYGVTFDPRGRYWRSMKEPPGGAVFAEPAADRVEAVARVVIAAAARLIRASGHQAERAADAVVVDRAMAPTNTRGERDGEATPLRN